MKKILFYLMMAGSLWAGTEIYNAVFYGSITAGSWSAIESFTGTGITNGTYTNAVTYHYRITATNSLGRFPYTTNAVSVTIDGTVTNGASLSWRYASRLTRYIIERGTNGTAWDEYTIVNPALTNVTDDGNLVWNTGSLTGMTECSVSSFEQIVSTNHNTLPGLQGGAPDASPTEYYHLDAADYAIATNAGARFTTIEGNITNLEAQVITNAYAETGAANGAELDGQQVKVTFREVAMTTYNAGDDVLVRANKTNVTATLAGTTYTVDGDAGTQLEMVQVRHAVSVGDSYSLVVTTNVMPMVGTRRVGNVFQAYNEANGNLIAGAQSRPDAADDTKFNVIGISAGGMTHALCKHLF